MSDSKTKPPASCASRLARYWLPPAICYGCITLFSTDLFSGENTHRLIGWLTSWFGLGVEKPHLGETNYALRKFMHFFEYAVFALLLFRALRADHHKHWQLRWIVYALLAVVSGALLDEFHQTLTKTRGGALADVLLDSAGGLTALLVITLYYRIKAQRAYSTS